MQTCWRLVHSAYLADAFNGEGARLAGGRWNSEGFSMVYTAASLSLSLLEIIVHLEFKETLKLYKAIPVRVPEKKIEAIDPAALPAGWNTPLPHPATLLTGNNWLRNQTSPALRVPSAIVPIESNILLNPAHPDFQSLEIGEPIDLPVDPRVMDKLK
ncbi:RES family NAD+ phosphorylase [Pontiella agarivorans]|uniref:RES family NAD+ phosphorylase n=1 Tax=Pontiella agarivorans TaxID=3038953 RepID=A0ABU5MX19_9BACT|nr:RES family NAD+ phosphorylase [Pontiella agarivorans]MDZ8118764.1 RES family NAD+ phosphorylase [Pontiella agarivorans]